ncbi:hypothetical protein IWX90DRAFT_410921 [Phyllosticta citrichinensis]|uniref:Uncharacterized protein n=1 Tax=Phyllosticta citrichinensis TaxID=1130410 RepID=A0ABR1Y7S2_9PEZI
MTTPSSPVARGINHPLDQTLCHSPSCSACKTCVQLSFPDSRVLAVAFAALPRRASFLRDHTPQNRRSDNIPVKTTRANVSPPSPRRGRSRIKLFTARPLSLEQSYFSHNDTTTMKPERGVKGAVLAGEIGLTTLDKHPSILPCRPQRRASPLEDVALDQSPQSNTHIEFGLRDTGSLDSAPRTGFKTEKRGRGGSLSVLATEADSLLALGWRCVVHIWSGNALPPGSNQRRSPGPANMDTNFRTSVMEMLPKHPKPLRPVIANAHKASLNASPPAPDPIPSPSRIATRSFIARRTTSLHIPICLLRGKNEVARLQLTMMQFVGAGSRPRSCGASFETPEPPLGRLDPFAAMLSLQSAASRARMHRLGSFLYHVSPCWDPVEQRAPEDDGSNTLSRDKVDRCERLAGPRTRIRMPFVCRGHEDGGNKACVPDRTKSSLDKTTWDNPSKRQRPHIPRTHRENEEDMAGFSASQHDGVPAQMSSGRSSSNTCTTQSSGTFSWPVSGSTMPLSSDLQSRCITNIRWRLPLNCRMAPSHDRTLHRLSNSTPHVLLVKVCDQASRVDQFPFIEKLRQAICHSFYGAGPRSTRALKLHHLPSPEQAANWTQETKDAN